MSHIEKLAMMASQSHEKGDKVQEVEINRLKSYKKKEPKVVTPSKPKSRNMKNISTAVSARAKNMSFSK